MDDVDRLESLFANGLIVAVVITAFSRGGNDVSNAVAPLIQSYFELATSEGVPLLEATFIISWYMYGDRFSINWEESIENIGK